MLTLLRYCTFYVPLTSTTSFTLQGGNTIRQLIKIAKKTVPEEEWKRTPVVLKATAGLRLLPQDKAHELLKEVRHVFLFALRQFGMNATRPAGEPDEKPLSAYKCHWKKEAASLPIWWPSCSKNSCCEVVWSNHICHLKY